MYDHAYLAGVSFWSAIWMAVYMLLPRHRPAILWTSVILAPVGAAGEYWSLQDYWHPLYLVEFRIGTWRFGIEDFLLTFTLSGICAGAVEGLAARLGFPELAPFTLRAWFRVVGWLSVGSVLFAVVCAARVGSIYALLGASAATSLLMLCRRGRLLALVVSLAILSGLLYWLFYVLLFAPLFPGVFPALWNLEKTWGVTWLGVPVEEVLWAAVTMLFAGPLLRVCSELILTDRKFDFPLAARIVP